MVGATAVGARSHLGEVFVGAGQQRIFEWVYNSPDIAAQRVVFVHAIDNPTLNRVNQAYPNRKLWPLEVKDTAYRMNELTLPER